MTQREYVQARAKLGILKMRARQAHERRRYLQRDEFCRQHDELTIRLREALQ